MKAGVEGIDLRGGAFGEAYGATSLVVPAIEPCRALRRIPIWKCLGVYEYHYMPTEPVLHHNKPSDACKLVIGHEIGMH
jgi:hypothetical protein